MADGDTCEEEAVEAVLLIHRPRVFNGDGYGWSVCVEDRQGWPCATAQAIERALGVSLKSMPELAEQTEPPLSVPREVDDVVEAAIVEFSGHVIDAGGGHVTISVDRDTAVYPTVGLDVDVHRRYPATIR